MATRNSATTSALFRTLNNTPQAGTGYAKIDTNSPEYRRQMSMMAEYERYIKRGMRVEGRRDEIAELRKKGIDPTTVELKYEPGPIDITTLTPQQRLYYSGLGGGGKKETTSRVVEGILTNNPKMGTLNAPDQTWTTSGMTTTGTTGGTAPTTGGTAPTTGRTAPTTVTGGTAQGTSGSGGRISTGLGKSIALPSKVDPRTRNLLKNLAKQLRAARAPLPPPPIAPYRYEGPQGYMPTGAQLSTMRSGGIQGTILSR